MMHLFAIMSVMFLANSAQGYSSVSDLESTMYEDMSNNGCYRQLNATGYIGCAVSGALPGAAPTVGTLMWYADYLQQGLRGSDRVLVIPEANVQAFLLTVMSNSTLKDLLGGVLVAPDGAPTSSSSLPRSPLSWASLYSTSHTWNPWGTGLELEQFPFPIYYLTEDITESAISRAKQNGQRSFKGALNIVEMSLTMWGRGNSSYCMATGTCGPIGSYTVWSAYPPLTTETTGVFGAPTRETTPITLVTAQLDSFTPLSDLTTAADTPLSGAIALLVALEALSMANDTAAYERQLVFSVIAGEPWGLQGSRRFLWEMYNGSQNLQGITLDAIDQVIEVGPVGLASRATGATQLYAHQQHESFYGDASPLVSTLVSAAANTTETTVTVSTASSSNPGLPPSSLWTFLRAKPSIQGVYLAEYDTGYLNPYTHSMYDDTTNVKADAILAAAIVLARTLHRVAVGPSGANLQIDATTLSARVTALISCLIDTSPGLYCSTATDLMIPDSLLLTNGTIIAAPILNYVGTLDARGLISMASPNYKPSVVVFLWNYMGMLTASGVGTTACDPVVNLCSSNMACIGWKSGTSDPATMGRCRQTSVAYVPSFTLRYEFGISGNYYTWIPSTASLAWEAANNMTADAFWTESVWDFPTLQMYMQENYSTNVAWIVIGIVLTVLSAAVSYLGRLMFESHLKTA